MLECKAVQNHKSALSVLLRDSFKKITFGHYFWGFAHFYNLYRVRVLVIMLMDCGYLCIRDMSRVIKSGGAFDGSVPLNL